MEKLTGTGIPQRHVSISIDGYEDLFSDFDPRPFDERNISDDFLYELRKVSGESEFHVSELRLLIPARVRVAENEAMIIRRLQAYFRKSASFLQMKVKRKKRRGWLFALTGCGLMIGGSFLSAAETGHLLLHLLRMIIEPAGWFLMWTGSDILVGASRKDRPEEDFLAKMARSHVVFLNDKSV